MKPVVFLAAPATILFCVAQTFAPAAAQTPLDPAPAKAGPLTSPQPSGVDVLGQSRAIRVRNVSADVMAYWLDPVHNAAAAWMQVPVPNQELAAQGKDVTVPGTFPAKTVKSLLPQGVTRIISVAPQNIIIAFGDAEATERLAALVTVLDKRLSQVEVEMHVVQVNDADASALIADDKQATPAVPNQTAVGATLADPNWFYKLTQLSKAGKATVLTRPRLLAVNNLATEIKTLQGRQADVRLKEPQGDADLNEALGNLDAPVMASIGMVFRVTPTVNEDETITVNIGMVRGVNLGVGDTPAVPVATLGEVKTTMRVQDGSAFVIRGQKASMFDPKAANPDAPVLVFVKATKVRRFGDER